MSLKTLVVLAFLGFIVWRIYIFLDQFFLNFHRPTL